VAAVEERVEAGLRGWKAAVLAARACEAAQQSAARAALDAVLLTRATELRYLLGRPPPGSSVVVLTGGAQAGGGAAGAAAALARRGMPGGRTGSGAALVVGSAALSPPSAAGSRLARALSPTVLRQREALFGAGDADGDEGGGGGGGGGTGLAVRGSAVASSASGSGTHAAALLAGRDNADGAAALDTGGDPPLAQHVWSARALGLPVGHLPPQPLPALVCDALFACLAASLAGHVPLPALLRLLLRVAHLGTSGAQRGPAARPQGGGFQVPPAAALCALRVAAALVVTSDDCLAALVGADAGTAPTAGFAAGAAPRAPGGVTLLGPLAQVMSMRPLGSAASPAPLPPRPPHGSAAPTPLDVALEALLGAAGGSTNGVSAADDDMPGAAVALLLRGASAHSARVLAPAAEAAAAASSGAATTAPPPTSPPSTRSDAASRALDECHALRVQLLALACRAGAAPSAARGAGTW
jgi:hypothetical protein